MVRRMAMSNARIALCQLTAELNEDPLQQRRSKSDKQGHG